MQTEHPLIKRGILTAKAKNDEWKLRWCVLQGVTFGTYNSRTDKEPQKVVNVYGAEVHAFKEPRRPFGIAMVTKNGTRYEMAAESETDQADWIARIADVAKHGTKSQYIAGSGSGRIPAAVAAAPPTGARKASVATATAVAPSRRGPVDEALLRKEVPAAAAAAAARKLQPPEGGSTRKKMFASEGELTVAEATAGKNKGGSAISHHSQGNASTKGLTQSADDAGNSPVQQAHNASPQSIIPQKILDLYEKNKNRLLQGGIGKEEFSRNSEIILQVLNVEQDMDETAKRHSRFKKIDASSLTLSKSSEAESPEAPHAKAVEKRSESVKLHVRSSSEEVLPSPSASAPVIPVAATASKTGHRSQHFIERRDSMKFEKKHKTLTELCASGEPGKRFKKMVKIGEGSFGMVFMAKDIETGQKVAIKKMAVTKKNKIHLETELALHRASSDHPNVVPIIEAFVIQEPKCHEVWVVLQFLEYGALTETLTQLDMREPDIAYVCKQLVNALSWLHSRNVVHRDIKSDNILLGSGGEVKLADFGLAIELVKGAEKRRSILGTPFWMSPEIINGKDYDDKVDIWAMGVTTIEMMTKNPPYSGYPKTKALFLITSQGVPLTHLNSLPQWTAALKDWLAKCLTYDPAARPNIWKMANHPFLLNASSVDSFIKHCIVPMKGKVKQCVLQ